MKNIFVTKIGGPAPRAFVHEEWLSIGDSLRFFRFTGVNYNLLAYRLNDQSDIRPKQPFEVKTR
jgi:hypothetical protein